MAHYLATSFRRLGEHEREDILQQFIADRLLVRRLMEAGSESPVSFRRFLVTCLRNFTISYMRKGKVRTRHLAPDADLNVALDQIGSEDRVDVFDAVWALEVIREAAARTEEEFQRNGRTDIWEVFYAREYIAIDRGQAPESYDLLAKRLGQSIDRLRNLLVTGKRAYGRHLRAVVGQYVSGSQTAEDEIRELRQILASGSHLSVPASTGQRPSGPSHLTFQNPTSMEMR